MSEAAEAGLVRAVLAGELITPHYQPIVNLRSNAVVGYEALSRFDLASSMNPEQWFHAAARTQHQVEFELLAVRKALGGLDYLVGERTTLAVNVCQEALLSVDLLGILAGTLQTHRVVLELTEHSEVCDYKPLTDALPALHFYGCRLSVDDVGSGFATLRRILELQPDYIKIDRSITEGVVEGEHERAILRAFVLFSQDIDCRVIVEGIETQEQKQAVMSTGVRFGQGYLLGRPQPLGKVRQ